MAAAGRRSADRIEAETRAVARKLGHHGVNEVAGEMRARGVAVTDEFVRRIVREEGGKV